MTLEAALTILFGGVGWGIELVRDGDNLEEHLARFKAGGAYM